MKLSKILIACSFFAIYSSFLSAQKAKTDSVDISTIPVEEMTFEDRTNYLFEAVEAKDQIQVERLSWSLAYYKHDNSGETALTKAINQGDIELIRILSEKAVINLKNKAGETPLTLAIKKNNKAIIEMVAKRAKAALKNDLDEAPLWLATQGGDLFVMQMLIDNGARLDVQSQGRTPVSIAVEKAQMQALALLLKNGADPSLLDQDGVLPLSKAIAAKDLSMAKMLLKKSKNPNADVNWKNAIGEPVLQSAIRTENQAMVRLLLDYGAHANAQNYFDNGSLHVAAELGNLELVRLLLENGADALAENMMGETAADLAKANKHQNIIDHFSSIQEATKGIIDLAGFK